MYELSAILPSGREMDRPAAGMKKEALFLEKVNRTWYLPLMGCIFSAMALILFRFYNLDFSEHGVYEETVYRMILTVLISVMTVVLVMLVDSKPVFRKLLFLLSCISFIVVIAAAFRIASDQAGRVTLLLYSYYVPCLGIIPVVYIMYRFGNREKTETLFILITLVVYTALTLRIPYGFV